MTDKLFQNLVVDKARLILVAHKADTGTDMVGNREGDKKVGSILRDLHKEVECLETYQVEGLDRYVIVSYLLVVVQHV